MSADGVVCPRCAHGVGRSLGKAGSLLEWYACAACRYVWAAGMLPQPAPVAQIERPSGLPARKHVLVADDDPSILSLVERILTNYRVSTARDGSEALAILCGAGQVDLLITDYLMPVMTGSELVSQARATRPDLAVLVMTGHGDTLSTAEPAWWGAEVHVAKPFQMVTFLAAVERLIGAPTPRGIRAEDTVNRGQ